MIRTAAATVPPPAVEPLPDLPAAAPAPEAAADVPEIDVRGSPPLYLRLHILRI